MLRLLFLRLRPFFFLLIDLLRSVTFVRETIFKLLSCSFILAILINVNRLNAKSYSLIIGEHLELPLKDLSKYVIGNKEILSYHYDAARETLLIKARSPGKCELVIWFKNGQSIKHLLTVSKEREISLTEQLKKLNLELEKIDGQSVVGGEISSLATYQALHRLKRRYPYLQIKSKLQRQLRNEIMAEVYYSFYQEYIDEIYCRHDFIVLECIYPPQEEPSEALLQRLKNDYFISFRPSLYNQQSNYRLQLKIVQKNSNTSSGFWASLSNFLNFSAGRDQSHILTQPSIVVHLDTPFTMSTGMEMSVSKSNSKGEKIDSFKFIGLTFEGIIQQEKGKLKLKYDINYSSPNSSRQGHISSNQESSSTYINLNEEQNIFTVLLDSKNYQTNAAVISAGEISGSLNYKEIDIIIKLSKI